MQLAKADQGRLAPWKALNTVDQGRLASGEARKTADQGRLASGEARKQLTRGGLHQVRRAPGKACTMGGVHQERRAAQLTRGGLHHGRPSQENWAEHLMQHQNQGVLLKARFSIASLLAHISCWYTHLMLAHTSHAGTTGLFRARCLCQNPGNSLAIAHRGSCYILLMLRAQGSALFNHNRTQCLCAVSCTATLREPHCAWQLWHA